MGKDKFEQLRSEVWGWVGDTSTAVSRLRKQVEDLEGQVEPIDSKVKAGLLAAFAEDEKLRCKLDATEDRHTNYYDALDSRIEDLEEYDRFVHERLSWLEGQAKINSVKVDAKAHEHKPTGLQCHLCGGTGSVVGKSFEDAEVFLTCPRCHGRTPGEYPTDERLSDLSSRVRKLKQDVLFDKLYRGMWSVACHGRCDIDCPPGVPGTCPGNFYHVDYTSTLKQLKELRERHRTDSEEEECADCAGSGVDTHCLDLPACSTCGGTGRKPKPPIVRDRNHTELRSIFEHLRQACMVVEGDKMLCRACLQTVKLGQPMTHQRYCPIIRFDKWLGESGKS